MFCIYYVYISIFVCMKFSVCTELNQYMSVDLELGGVVNLFCSPQRFAQKGSLFISNLGISPWFKGGKNIKLFVPRNTHSIVWGAFPQWTDLVAPVASILHEASHSWWAGFFFGMKHRRRTGSVDDKTYGLASPGFTIRGGSARDASPDERNQLDLEWHIL